MLQNATLLRKSPPWSSNTSNSCVSCIAPATRHASFQILFKCPTPTIFQETADVAAFIIVFFIRMILWKLFSTFRQRQPGPCDILMTFCRTPLSALIMVPAFHFKVGLLTGFAGHVWSDRSAAGQQRRLNYFTSVRSRLTSDTNNNNFQKWTEHGVFSIV